MAVNWLQEEKKKKRLLFYIDFSQLFEYQEDMIRKIEYVIETANEQKEQIELIWKEDDLLFEYEYLIEDSVIEKYQQLTKQVVTQNIGQYITKEDEISEEELIEMSDAYYGDPSRIAFLCVRAKKPVMIENADIVDRTKK